MSPEHLFSIANTIAVVSWLLLAILPRRRWVTEVVTGKVVPALFGALYIGLIVSMFGRAEGGFSTLAGVAALFANSWLLLAGWVHYLAFDLLIGTWEVRDAQERGIPHMFVVPCLFLTFMFGPAGWLLYLTLRSTLQNR
jgi:ABC-type Na+ efflux pump permease subunit